MARTYSLVSKSSKGGMTQQWTDGVWSNYYFDNNNGETRRCGQTWNRDRYCATYYMFDADTLASLKQKTITSVKLTITVTDGTGIPSGSSELYAVREKLNNAEGSDGSSSAWKGGSSILGYVRRASGVSSTTFDLTLSNTIPTYGYVIGPNAAGYGQILWLASSATLTVVTNEVDYTVSYNKGANGTGTNTSDTKVYGVALTLKGRIFTRTGYTQDGWSTSDGGGIAYALGGSYTANASVTLYPYWTPNTYTVTYNKGSYGTGSQVTDTKTYGVALTLRGATFTRSNYTQDGWSVNSNGSTKDYNLSGSYTNNAAVTLYPHWKADTYAVNFNANGGTGAPAAQTKTYGVNLTLSSTVPTRTNYIFLGWATSATGEVAYQPGGSYTANAAVTLYAIWQVAKSTLSTITSSVNIGSSGTASWNIVNSAYTFKLVITYENAPAVTVNVEANTSSTSFTIPTTWYAYLPNVTSVTATATLTTYSGSTSLGSTTKTFTVAVASSVKPTISSFTHAPYAQNSTVNGWQVYVQGYSQVDLSVSASAGDGASITDITFSGTGITKDTQHPTATTARSAVLTNTGRISGYSVTVTDSRGRSVSAEITGDNRPYFYEYSYPAVTSITAFRSNSNGDVDSIGGTYIHTSAKFKFSDCGTNHNQLTIKKIEYKLHSASQWTSAVDPATSEQEYTIGGGNINITSSYDVRCTIRDSLLHEATATVLIPPIVGFSIGLNNDRARFGGPVEKAGLQIDWPIDYACRRSTETLSSKGWYRVLSFDSGHATDSSDAMGVFGAIIDVFIARRYGNQVNEVHKVTLLLRYNGVQFVDETSSSGVLAVTKIRWNYETGNTSKGYLDIYYDLNLANIVCVWCNVYPCYPTGQNWFLASGLSSVAASPSGETVLATHDFIANGHNYTLPIYMNGTLIHS